MVPEGNTAIKGPTISQTRSLYAELGIVLIVDGKLGAIWKLNVKHWRIRDNHQGLMNPSSDPSSLGVNGIKIMNGYIYHSNTRAGTFNRIHINADGVPVGPVTEAR